MPVGGNMTTELDSRRALFPAEQNYADVLLLDAWTRPSLVVTRSLGRRGLRTAALTTCNTLPCPTFSSRWCQQKFVCHAREGSLEYLTYLQQVLESTHPEIVIPSADGTVELIRRYRPQLERATHIALAQEPALGIAVNKEQTLQIAQHLGLAIPRGVRLNTGEKVTEAVHEIGLPAVVKPLQSWSVEGEIRQHAQIVTTLEEARKAVDLLTCMGGSVLFQQYLSGRREAVSFFYARRQIYARFAQWAKRTLPPLGGTSVLRQSIAIPSDIGEQAEHLVQEIDLEGYSEVEFRRDHDGRAYLMEINPRLSASVELAVRSGVDFPCLLYQWARGDRIEMVENYRTGLWMRFLGGDIATTMLALRQRGRPGVASPARAILDFCFSLFVPMKYDYLDWRDPLPMWTATIGYPRCSQCERKENLHHSGKAG